MLCVCRFVSVADIYQLLQCELDKQGPVYLYHCQSVGTDSYHSSWLHPARQRYALTTFISFIL